MENVVNQALVVKTAATAALEAARDAVAAVPLPPFTSADDALDHLS